MSETKAVSGPSPEVQILVDGQPRRLHLARSAAGDTWTGMLDGEAIEVNARLHQTGVLSLILGGHAFRCVLDEGPLETAIHIGGERYIFSIEDPRAIRSRLGKSGTPSGRQVIKAPMPGRIVRLLVEPGEQVAAHQDVVVIEAMKMQNALKATRAGVVAEIKTEPGATVAAGAVLLVIA